jgi:hypothetical protein
LFAISLPGLSPVLAPCRTETGRKTDIATTPRQKEETSAETGAALQGKNPAGRTGSWHLPGIRENEACSPGFHRLRQDGKERKSGFSAGNEKKRITFYFIFS